MISIPQPSTPILPPFPSNAALWAQLSIPTARPLTTVIPILDRFLLIYPAASRP